MIRNFCHRINSRGRERNEMDRDAKKKKKDWKEDALEYGRVAIAAKTLSPSTKSVEPSQRGNVCSCLSRVPFLSCLRFHRQERVKRNETKTRERERETKLGRVSSTSLRGLSWRNNACTSFKKKSKFSALISNPFAPILSRTLCSRLCLEKSLAS